MIKKTFPLIFLVVTSLLLVSSLATTSASSGAEVTGVITQNTTWTKAGGPYTLTGTVFVNSGVTLTIESGTTVYFNDHSIRVNGTLTARGTVDNQITFISLTPTLWSSEGIVVFLPGASGWNEQAQSGCIVQYANVTYNQPVPAFYIDASSPKISNCTIIDPLPNNYDRAEAIEIVSSTNASAAPIISFNTIGNAAYIGIYEGGNLGNSVIYGNYIYDCHMGIWSRGKGAITFNLFRGNNVAISLDSVFSNDANTNVTNRVTQNNTFIENYYALSAGYMTSVTSGVAFNNFFNNAIDVQGGSSFVNGVTINVSKNWWGTTDMSAVNGLMDVQGATVNMQPILTAINPNAPSTTYNPTAVTSTSSPTPTASPSASPTAQPASTSSTQPTPAPTSQQPNNAVTSNSPTPTETSPVPTIPEYPTIIIIIGIFSALALVTLAYTKKNKKQTAP
jgi:hypothetical protein